jgi:hypothetical protein
MLSRHVLTCRPLVLGQRDTQDGPEYCVASEDCAFGPIGYRRVRDVRPGEMIIISPEVRRRATLWSFDACHYCKHDSGWPHLRGSPPLSSVRATLRCPLQTCSSSQDPDKPTRAQLVL